MRAEVIAIGDELTSGERLDTNSRWLSQRLVENGIPVLYHSTVGDDSAACKEVIERAIARAEIVLLTGGLGPTADDLTRDAIAVATGTSLQIDESMLVEIEAMFRRRGRDMPERNRVQAMFPTGSRPIPNRHGTAPGIEMRVLRGDETASHLFALPGVPAEMKPMWQETVLARLNEIAPQSGVIRHRQLKCFGVGESQLEAMLPDLIRRGREPSVGITVHAATITLRVTARGRDAAECEAQMAPTIATIRACLGTLVFGEDDDELHHATARLLQQSQQTVATVECASGGLVAEWYSEIDEEGVFFRGGEVRPRSDFARGESLAAASLAEFVEQLASEIRERRGADFGLAIGPLPEVDTATAAEADKVDEEAASRERFYYALADRDGCQVYHGRALAHPAIRKELAGKQALDRLRRRLLGEPSAEA
ncbi:MAG: damage-inducible protein CinA [Planctomycetota bacterium]|nr:MAG: damage-inducible protein CinA [Planctomycetota bacterium]REK43179.1 MAG: damage-inducible protein CinA [Planctomycetota bacterium]